MAQAIHPKEDQHRKAARAGRPFGGAQVSGDAKRGSAESAQHAVAAPVRAQDAVEEEEDDNDDEGAGCSELQGARVGARVGAGAAPILRLGAGEGGSGSGGRGASSMLGTPGTPGAAGAAQVPGADWSQPIRDEIRKEREENFRRMYRMQSAEVVAGRGTMAAGLWGLVQEVTSGRSLPEQLGVGVDWGSLSAAEAMQIQGQQAVALLLLAVAVFAARPGRVGPDAGRRPQSKAWPWTIQVWSWPHHRLPAVRNRSDGPPTP